MSSYTYPGVYIQELQSPVHAIAGVATSIAAFVGYTARGIDNRAQAIYSFADYQRLYGGLASNSEVSYAVQQFYLNGGGQAYVVRTPMHYGSGAAVYATAGFGTGGSFGSAGCGGASGALAAGALLPPAIKLPKPRPSRFLGVVMVVGWSARLGGGNFTGPSLRQAKLRRPYGEWRFADPPEFY